MTRHSIFFYCSPDDAKDYGNIFGTIQFYELLKLKKLERVSNSYILTKIAE